jgi:hypothetical protein
MDHTPWPGEEPREERKREKDRPRREEDPAEPEWVLERIQQSFETRRS